MEAASLEQVPKSKLWSCDTTILTRLVNTMTQNVTISKQVKKQQTRIFLCLYLLIFQLAIMKGQPGVIFQLSKALLHYKYPP